MNINNKYLAFSLALFSVVILIVNLALPSLRPEYIDNQALTEFFRWIDANSEYSLPAWYSAILLFIASITSYVAYKVTNIAGKYQIMWFVLSLGFIFMSVDEASTIHEHFGLLIPDSFGANDGSFAASWVAVALVIIVPLGLAFIPFLFSLPNATLLQFILAGGIFLSGAIVLEVVGARIFTNQETTHLYHYFVSFEEWLEMVGVIIFIMTSIFFINKNKIMSITLEIK